MKEPARKLTDILGWFRVFLKLLFRTGKWQSAIELTRLKINPFFIQRGPQGAWVEPLGMLLDKARQWPWLLQNLDRANLLKTQAGAVFYERQSDLIIELRGLKLLVSSGEEMFTLDELFVRRVYDFAPPALVVVVDIGMNVGYASLMFAARPEVVSVYGYEPFPATYQQARRSFDMNPACAGKIHSENVGLAGSSKTMIAGYNPQYKGAAGVFRSPRSYFPKGDSRWETIQLKSAVESLDAVFSAHPGSAIVAKIDCEGAEYEIIGALAASGRLSHFAALMIEWHRFADGQDPALLLGPLRNAGFFAFTMDCRPAIAGMIYAARTLA